MRVTRRVDRYATKQIENQNTASLLFVSVYSGGRLVQVGRSAIRIRRRRLILVLDSRLLLSGLLQQLRWAHLDDRLRVLNYSLRQIILCSCFCKRHQNERVQKDLLALLSNRIDDVRAHVVQSQILRLLLFSIELEYVPRTGKIILDRFGVLTLA